MLKFLSKQFFYPLFLYKEGNSKYLKLLKEVEGSYALPPQELQNLRRVKLKKIFLHAYKESSFYKDLFDRNSFVPEMAEFDGLMKLPVLTKDIISSNRDNIICRNSLSPLVRDSTGGSTAEPFIFYRDQECLYRKNAYQLYFNKLLGWDIGTRYALIWGASKDLYKHYGIKQRIKDKFIFRKIQLNAIKMSKEALEDFVIRLQSFNPEIIYGYPTAIDILSKYMKENNQHISGVRSVICTAEPLRDELRENIGGFFQCDVYDRYTSREAGILAQECSVHKGLHVNSLSVHLEIRNNKILVTDLDNFGMPLINYEIGDMTKQPVFNKSSCSCGLNTERMELGASRETDFFVKRDGTIIFGAGIPIMKLTGEKGVKNIQIVQKDYEKFEVNLVKTKDFSNENLSRIESVLKGYIGNDIEINFNYLEKIDRISSSGKYRYVISEVTN